MATGQTVWFDLVTSDVDAATSFYTETIGWKAQQWTEADPSMPYTLLMAGETGVGGVMPIPPEAKALNVPPHWLSYTTVDDVDKSVAQAEKLGGKVLRSGFDIPNVGRIAILADPQGAAFGIYKPQQEMPAPEGDETGRISWNELNTTDYQAAWKFYAELFGWQEHETMEMGEIGSYLMFKDPAERTKGGMSNVAGKLNVPAHWLFYITVKDIDATLARVKHNGGKVLNGPMKVPGDDLIAQCLDPQGAGFALYASGK